MVCPALGQLLGGARRKLNDDVAFSLPGEGAEQRKYLALEGMMGSRHLNELALWNMPVCSMVVRVPSGTKIDRWRSPPISSSPNGSGFSNIR
jgi:hypothetical protein